MHTWIKVKRDPILTKLPIKHQLIWRNNMPTVYHDLETRALEMPMNDLQRGVFLPPYTFQNMWDALRTQYLPKMVESVSHLVDAHG